MSETTVESVSTATALREAPPAPTGEPAQAAALPPPVALPAGPSTLEVWRKETILYLRTRGVGTRALVGFSLAFAATSAFVFVLNHPGLASILGFVALISGELSLVRVQPQSRESADLAKCLNPLVDLLIAAGLVGGIVGRQPPVVVVFALIVLVLNAWLPLLTALAGPSRIPTTTGLWQRADRLGILLAGALLGRLGPALFVLATIMVLDAWLRLERLDQPLGLPQAQQGPQGLEQIIRPDGTFVPVVRWASIAATLVILVVLPASDLWRF